MRRDILEKAIGMALSIEHPPGHRCLECRVLRVAFSGASEESYIREGFRKREDGKWEDVEPKEGT